MDEKSMQKAITWVAAARSISVLTGAGVSKESGIPTFRDALEGMWANFDPAELASPQGFRRNPTRVWQWYAERREKLEEVQPNPAHYALARLEQLKPLTLITQNIDGLHEIAGSKNIIELHGNLRKYKCFKKGHPISSKLARGAKEPPTCQRCGSLARPDVVWFGEMLPLGALQRARDAAIEGEVMLVIGTSGIVHPAADLPLYAAHQSRLTIEINPEQTALTPYLDLHLAGPAGSVMAELIRGVEEALK